MSTTNGAGIAINISMGLLRYLATVSLKCCQLKMESILTLFSTVFLIRTEEE